MWLGWRWNEPSIGELMVRLETFLSLFLLRRWSFYMTPVVMLVNVNAPMQTVELVC
jgi:hypothetical protein